MTQVKKNAQTFSRRHALKATAAALLTTMAGAPMLVCAQTANGATPQRKVLVVYFSKTGNTRAIAQEIHRAVGGDLANGAFMGPTLLGGVNNQMCVAQEEIFGPVASVIKFKTEEEAIAIANDSVYGLGGGVFTADINRALRVAMGIRTGRMWVNTYNQIPEGSPFGGYKESGIGRETHAMILEHYTQCKNILINLSEAPSGFYS